MGDMPEPKYHTMDRDNTSVMSKVTATLGRNFVKTKEFQEAQLMGMEQVRVAAGDGATLLSCQWSVWWVTRVLGHNLQEQNSVL